MNFNKSAIFENVKERIIEMRTQIDIIIIYIITENVIIVKN